MRPALTRVCQYLACAVVVAGIVPLVWPILMPDFLVGHDAAAHQTYAFLFDRAIEQGQIPVRWVEGIADGLGQPLFNHYQVGFYYLVALVHWAGPDLSLALKLTIALAWAGGASFMFLLCRPLGTLPAALAAAVFMWSPYVLVDAYVRSAFPELTAMALTPGVLWSIDGVLRTGRRRFVCALALTAAWLLISHPPTALIMAPVALAFAAASWNLHDRPTARVRLLVAAGMLGAGLAAFYVAPAVLQIDAIHIGRITTGGFDYHHHFVEPQWWFDRSWGYAGSGQGAEDQMSLQIGIVQWAVLAAAVASLAVPRLRRCLPVPAVTVVSWLAIVAVALFLMTAPSAFVWEAIGPMTFIQFPWRWLMVPVLACGALAAVLLSCVRDRVVQAVVVVCVVGFQWQQNAPYLEAAADRERSAVAIDDAAWPATEDAQDEAFRESAYDPVSVHRETTPARGRWTVRGPADVTARAVTDARLDLSIAVPQPTELVIHSAAYPGWRISVDGQALAPGVDCDSGFMTIEIPAGSHRVIAAFGRDRLRTVAEGVTLLSAIAWLALAVGPAIGLTRRRP